MKISINNLYARHDDNDHRNEINFHTYVDWVGLEEKERVVWISWHILKMMLVLFELYLIRGCIRYYGRASNVDLQKFLEGSMKLTD